MSNTVSAQHAASIFWVMTLYTLADGSRNFGGAHCRNIQERRPVPGVYQQDQAANTSKRKGKFTVSDVNSDGVELCMCGRQGHTGACKWFGGQISTFRSKFLPPSKGLITPSLNTGVIPSTETSVCIYQTTQCRMPEERNPHRHRPANPKPYVRVSHRRHVYVEFLSTDNVFFSDRLA
jgi:hypothetical protein